MPGAGRVAASIIATRAPGARGEQLGVAGKVVAAGEQRVLVERRGDDAVHGAALRELDRRDRPRHRRDGRRSRLGARRAVHSPTASSTVDASAARDRR